MGQGLGTLQPGPIIHHEVERGLWLKGVLRLSNYLTRLLYVSVEESCFYFEVSFMVGLEGDALLQSFFI